MCILIHHTAKTAFDLDHLKDFYSHNSDGFGAMVNQGGNVKIIKTVGNLDEIHELYNNEIKGHEAVIHFRMKTHGDIDLFNCHPYKVTDNLWMAHNGILSTGNAADNTKSDTWHYIQNYLKPLLDKNPRLIHEPAFQKLLESHIGSSNKFGFMDSDGEIVIINRSAGVTHFDAWLSNTYAWSPSKFGYYKSYGHYDYGSDRYGRGGYGVWNRETGMWDKPVQSTLPLAESDTKKTKKEKRTKKSAKSADKYESRIGRLSTDGLARIIVSCYNAMNKDRYHGLVDWVYLHPMQAMHLIHEFYPNMYEPSEISDLVNASPEEAADVIEIIWDECEEDMCAIASIPFTLKSEDEYAEKYLY